MTFFSLFHPFSFFFFIPWLIDIVACAGRDEVGAPRRVCGTRAPRHEIFDTRVSVHRIRIVGARPRESNFVFGLLIA